MDGEEDNEAGEGGEGDLDVKGPAPADRVVDHAAEDATERRAEAKHDVADALPDTALAKGDEVGGDEGGDGGQAAAAHARDDPAEDDDPFVLREAADEVAGTEEDVGEDESGAAAVDVGQLPTQGLERGVGDEVRGS